MAWPAGDESPRIGAMPAYHRRDARLTESEMIDLQVKGMTCNHCAMAVTRALKEVDPGAQVKVDLAAGRVEVESGAAPAALAEAIVEAGYEVVAPAG